MLRGLSDQAEGLSEAGRPKVIYIMGAGRSGSTILGVALGNCENVFFAGELNRWLDRAGRPRRQGEELERLWRAVLDRVEDPAPMFGAKTACLERSSALLDVRKWPRRRRLRRGYRRVSDSLYRAIAGTTDATHIVDSSHYPLRAREMQALAGIDLYLLYLMRDPRQVVASLARRDVAERSFGSVAANAYLWLTQLLSVFVFLRHSPSRRMFVRHEHFLINPELVLSQILRQFHCASPVPDLAELDTGLPFHGNRLIESRRVRLQAEPPRAVRGSRLTWLIQLPWSVTASWLGPAARVT